MTAHLIPAVPRQAHPVYPRGLIILGAASGAWAMVGLVVWLAMLVAPYLVMVGSLLK